VGELRVGREYLTQSDKGTHDLDVHKNGVFGAENTGQHRNTLLRKGIRRMTSAAAAI